VIETAARAFATRRMARQAQASTRSTDRHLAGFTIVQRYDVEIAVTLPHKCCAADHSFSEGQVYRKASLFGRFDPKGGRDAGRDFYDAVGNRSTAWARSPAVEHIPLNTVQCKEPIRFQESEPRRGRSCKRRAACQASSVTDERLRSEPTARNDGAPFPARRLGRRPRRRVSKIASKAARAIRTSACFAKP
jgi:hypothetical protein